MKIFKELNKLGYIHYSATTIEELDDLPLNSAERISEQALVLRWFREKYSFVGTILGDGFNGELKGYYYSITEEGWINYFESIDDGKWYDTYEEAELACITKLIKIIKKK